MPELQRYVFHEPVVIANEVKQSMTPEARDRRATLAMTEMANAMTVQGPCAVSGRIRDARNDEFVRVAEILKEDCEICSR
jgi:hypothetical protein